MSSVSSKKQAITQATRRASAIESCDVGRHTLTPTFRAGEQMCTTCGVVFACPTCSEEHQLPPLKSNRVFALPCEKHREAGVQ